MISLSTDKLNIISAFTSKNRYIGLEGDLPWKRSIKGDMRFINKLIRMNPNTLLIVGRATFESLPKYKGISFAVVSSKSFTGENIFSFKTFDDAASFGLKNHMTTIVFGGSNIYYEALKYQIKAFITIVEEEGIQGDRTFPEHSLVLTDITSDVSSYLIENQVDQTWTLEDGFFKENGYSYKFYCTGD